MVIWGVNENFDERRPGDVQLFDSVDAMLVYYEPWFALESHLIFSDNGEAYKFKNDNETLALERRTDLDLSASELRAFQEHIEQLKLKPLRF